MEFDNTTKYLCVRDYKNLKKGEIYKCRETKTKPCRYQCMLAKILNLCRGGTEGNRCINRLLKDGVLKILNRKEKYFCIEYNS
ncbi:MAG: hypothetical protein ACOC22_02850 [bacterium]